MPYEIRNGNEVWHKKNGKWSLKQKTKSPENAKASIRLLYGIESGSIDTGNKSRIDKIKGEQK